MLGSFKRPYVSYTSMGLTICCILFLRFAYPFLFKTKWLCIDFYGRYLSVLIWLHILIRVLKNMSLITYLHNVGILSVFFFSCKQNSGRPSLHNCSYYRLKTTSQRSRSGKCYRIKQNIITLIFASSYLLLNW